MKIGVKTYNNKEFLLHFQDKVDFFEIMAIRTNNYDFVKKLDKPIVIHAEHRLFGINLADSTLTNTIIESINFAKKIADLAGSKKIIIHPGNYRNEFCSKENSLNIINKIYDKRILLENLTIEKIKSLCTIPNETKEFLTKTRCGFIFDINHAIITATNLNQDYMKMIKEFLKLNPTHFHLGGQSLKLNKDHLQLKSSDFKLKEIINLLPNNAEITLETEPEIYKTESDIKILKNLINKKNK